MHAAAGKYMSRKIQAQAVVLRQEQITEGIFSLLLGAGEIAREAVPGQFISLYSKDSGRMLPRPISICEIDRENGTLRLVYRAAGQGTKEFSNLYMGDTIDVIGPLGNGYPLDRAEGKRVFLIGGGIGIPPLVELSKALKGTAQSVAAVIGYRDAQTFLREELAANADMYIATEDGSIGTKGNVLDCIRENKLQADVIYACGPTPMLRALKAYAAENNMQCWLSLEERMACGIGACLACVCKSKDKDEHSQVHNKRICAEGPVFAAEEIEL